MADRVGQESALDTDSGKRPESASPCVKETCRVGNGAFHAMSTARDADALFDAARELMKVISAQIAEKRERRKQARSAKAKARYAAKKAAGTLPAKRKKFQATRCWEPEPPQSCYCAACSRPPCSWCENGGEP